MKSIRKTFFIIRIITNIYNACNRAIVRICLVIMQLQLFQTMIAIDFPLRQTIASKLIDIKVETYEMQSKNV